MVASFSLIIEDDAGKQIVVPFAKDVITIGRQEGNTIRLTERNVSRAHAKLSKEDGHVLVEDLKSFNGVKLNGDRIAGRVQVAAGDVIEIGDYHLELRSAQPATAATQKFGPAGAKSAGVAAADDEGGDDFEGDTQRWDPPSGGPAPVTAAPTQESPGQFGDNSGDTEKLDLDKLNALGGLGSLSQQGWPPPQRAPAPAITTGEMEPTARQPVANVPIGGMAPPPPQAPAPMMTLEPVPEDATQDMPLPAVAAAAAAAAAPAAPPAPPPAAPPRPAAQPRESEQTEQLRPAPAINPADDLTQPRLVVLNTIFAGSTFPLKAAEAVLGRTDDNDIVLEHRSVSRNHAKLVREGERVRILDLKSANGVLVNNEEVDQHVLRSGDVIELGRVRIRFVPIGERFVVAPDEIERARIADAAGDDFEDGAHTVNVTSPIRPRESMPPTLATSPAKPTGLYIVVGVLVLVVVILLGVVLTRGGGGATSSTDPDETDPATTVASAADPTATPTTARSETPTTAPETAPTPTPEAAALTAPEPEAALELELPDEPATAGSDRTPRKRPARSSFDAAKAMDEARGLMFKREYSKAVALLEKVVDLNPKEARAHLNLGISYAQLRKSAKAKEHYQRFLALQPSGIDAERVRESLAALP